MAAINRRRKKVNPKEEAAHFASVCKDKDGFDVKYINSEKGRGVFSCVHFDKGDFLLEYRGELLSKHESEKRQKIYHDALKVFMFEFRYNGKLFCVDSSLDDSSLGRLVNDDHLNPNSKMRTITTEGKPHLCLFATRNISPGEEITYNYGDSEWPWRHKAVPEKGPSVSVKVPAMLPAKETEQNMAETTNLVTTSQILLIKDQQQSQQQHSEIQSKGEEETVNKKHQLQAEEQMPSTSSEAVPEKGPSVSVKVPAMLPAKETEQNVAETTNLVTSSQILLIMDQQQSQQQHSEIQSKGEEETVNKKHQLQAEEQMPSTSSEAVPEKGPSVSVKVPAMLPAKETEQNVAETTNLVISSQILLIMDQQQSQQQHSEIQSKGEEETVNKKHQLQAEEQMPSTSSENCEHKVVLATVSSMNKCIACVGPVASLRWVGLRCKVCSCFWHKSCFEKMGKSVRYPMLQGEIDSSSDEERSQSDEEYVPETDYSDSESDSAVVLPIKCSNKIQVNDLNVKAVPSEFSSLKSKQKGSAKKSVKPKEADLFCYEEHLSGVESHSEPDSSTEMEEILLNKVQVEPLSETSLLSEDTASVSGANSLMNTTEPDIDKWSAAEESVTDDFQEASLTGEGGTMAVTENCLQSSEISCSEKKKNYCYICGKPQSKIARHLETHMAEVEVAKALSFPKHSKERKNLLEKIRNKGNYQHNSDVLQKGSGLLKVKRRPNRACDSKHFVHCMHCKGMFVRKDLWRHVKRCSSNPGIPNKEKGRTRVLGLAILTESTVSQQISQGVWKLLSAMKQDEIASVVRNDFCILQLAQSFFNKHGNDSTKFEYIRQKLREIGRFLLTLRTESSVYSLEEAVKPVNFSKVIKAVKKVSGYDEQMNCYQTPSLALKLGHTLQKVCEIIHCRALMAEDEELIKSTETFKKLYTTKWSELVSHRALGTLNEARFNKPSTLPFTHDVQLLHKHLETAANAASENLRKSPSPQSYAELAKTTLARIIVFNRRRAGEVSKMLLKCFQDRDKTLLHEDVAFGLSNFEKKLCSHFCRVELKGKRGRKVAVLLTPSMVDALTLLVSSRKQCGVTDANSFLFARPSCQSYYRGQVCLRIYAVQCGAQNPQHLRSTHLRKHVATLSQVLNLKNNELDQVADFLGHDIRVHREYYRLPEATTQLAKISKLLLAMEKGCLPDLQGKSLDDIEIEDEINPTDDSEGSEPYNETADDSMSAPRQTEIQKTQTDSNSAASGSNADTKNPRKKTRTLWSKQEVIAVMKHFKPHINRGNLATIAECQQCKDAEDPVLASRTVQNIRDFVRNRGITNKRKMQSN